MPEPMSTLALFCFRDQMESTMLFFVGARLRARLLLLVSLELGSEARPKTVGKRLRSKSSLSSVMWSLMMLSFCRTGNHGVQLVRREFGW